MTAKDAVVSDMRHLLAFHRPPPAVQDQATAERLLAGRLDPADASPADARLVRLLAAATGPAIPDELAGQAAAAAAFAAVARSTPPTPIPRRASMPSKLRTLKATAVALGVVVAIGGVAAATTGLLPTPTQPVGDQAPTSARAGDPAHAPGDTPAATVASTRAGEAALGGLCRAYLAGQGGRNGKRNDALAFQALAAAAGGAEKIAGYCQQIASTSTPAARQDQAGASGPDATGAAKTGLCRAYLAGQGGSSGKRNDAPAFRALAAAAGGADKIAGYCQATTPGRSATHRQGQGAPPSTSPGQGTPPTTGPGQGHGGPTTTTLG